MPRLPDLVSGDITLYKTVITNGITGYGTNTPPGGPASGDCYIVGTAPTGAWVGSDNKIAIYNGATWDYIPTTGAIGTAHRNLVAAQNGGGETYRWFGSSWTKYAAPGSVNEVSYTYDPYPQYAMRDEIVAAGGTDLSYTAATRVLASSTGADVTLPLVSSGDAGLAPASGGGTTNFLRADGTWNAPAGGSGDMVLASAQTNSGAKTFLDATLLMRNVADTFSSKFTNTNSAARTYTLKDTDGTLAFTTDITGTNSGTNTGDQTSIVGITGTSAQFNTANTDDNFAFVGAANTFTANQTIRMADDGAGSGPDLYLDRNSASPAASDTIGNIYFTGRNDAAATKTYGYFGMSINDPAAGTEDATFSFAPIIAGAFGGGVAFRGNFADFYLNSASGNPFTISLSRYGNMSAATEVGRVVFAGYDASGGYDTWGRIKSVVTTATAGAEAAYLSLEVVSGGTLTERFRIGDFGGLGIGGATYGTSGQFLKSGGSAAAPAWSTIANADIPNGINNASRASQSQVVVSGTAYYITRSNLTLPATPLGGMVVGTTFIWRVAMTKTAAGTGTFRLAIYRGTNGSTADTQDVLQTLGTQTAAVDNMTVDVMVVVTATGATGSYYWTMTPQNKAVTATGFGIATGAGAFFSGTVSSVALNTASLQFGLGFVSNTGTPTIVIPMVQAQAWNMS